MVACTVAGSDSGGGAGVQADLKTFQACGVFGTSVIVAVTAQNTLGVSAVHLVPPEVVAAQFDAVAQDLAPAAYKTGMLASRELVECVVDRLRAYPRAPLVVDPVMVAKSGARLLDPGALSALREHLLPLATVLTPNLPEAEILAGFSITSPGDRRRAAEQLATMGPEVVILKGGHSRNRDTVTDLILVAASGEWLELTFPRVPGTSTHGTGCTLSAAIAAFLARGCDPLEAARSARAYLQGALLRAPGLGAGHGPLGHMDPGLAAPVVRGE
ncbi:MAG: bifunctional hydroxymethylpyrimidine kinase/phosphomethylpyrimidine kinase [Candidatus Dormibacteria bacterium]